MHTQTVQAWLERLELDEDALECGPHAPDHEPTAHELIRRGHPPGRIHNNCSGKHAGMIALAIGMGWDPVDYHLAEHPVQRRMAAEVSRWSGLEESAIPTAVDGCGVVCFATTLDVMAASFARFTAAGDRGEAPGTVSDAMATYPFMVGGTQRTCTDVMDVAGDRVFVKLGAEGVYGGGLRGRGLGFAMKVEDGGRRAVEVALVHLLEQLGVITEAEAARLARHGNPPVRNTLGDVVGEVRADFELSALAPVEA